MHLWHKGFVSTPCENGDGEGKPEQLCRDFLSLLTEANPLPHFGEYQGINHTYLRLTALMKTDAV